MHTIAQARAAGAVWLLSLVTYCGTHPQLVGRLQELQDTFFSLLGDSGGASAGGSGLVQEVASRGVSACYSRARDEAHRKQLLDAFVASLQGAACVCKEG